MLNRRFVMPQAPPVQDFLIRVRIPDEELLALSPQRQQELEAYPGWSERSRSQFLMQLGEDLCRLAFPTDDALGDFITALASAVKSNAALRLWIQAEDPALAMLPWEYLCLTEAAVDWCRSE